MADDIFVVATSLAQRSLWFVNEMDPGMPAYNVTGVVRIRGPLVRELLGTSAQCGGGAARDTPYHLRCVGRRAGTGHPARDARRDPVDRRRRCRRHTLGQRGGRVADAFFHGYSVWVASDCVVSAREEDRQRALERLDGYCATVADSAEILRTLDARGEPPRKVVVAP